MLALLIHVIIVIVIVGLILWIVNSYVPMPPPIKTVLNVAVAIIILLWLLSILGAFSVPWRVH